MVSMPATSWLARAAVWLLAPMLACASPAEACCCAGMVNGETSACCSLEPAEQVSACCCSGHDAGCDCCPGGHSDACGGGRCGCSVLGAQPVVPGQPALELQHPADAGWQVAGAPLLVIPSAIGQASLVSVGPPRDLVIELRVLRI